MAHQKPDEEDSSSSPVEEAIPYGGGHGSTSSSAEEKSRPTNCLLAARSLRSTTTIPAAQAQSHRSLSFSKLLSFRLPSTMGYIDRLDDEESVPARVPIDEEKLKRICRSQSVPTSLNNAKAGSTRRVGPAAGFRVLVVSNDLEGEGAAGEEAEDIAAEEAVCRICMVELSEGGALLKLECSCKGELALAHSGCAIKWFSIKGNGACDVCGHEVLNLPITLQICHQLSATQQQQQQQNAPTSTTSRRYSRVLHGRTILVIISMLGYFCFLEQLLVGDHGTAALAISLPFACVLGLFSSLTTIKMVSRRYVWIYSAAQFLFIVLFTNLFYRYVRIQAVIAIILSTFAGFSVAICANSILLQILRWRARRVASPAITEEEPHGHSTDLESAQPPS